MKILLPTPIAPLPSSPYLHPPVNTFVHLLWICPKFLFEQILSCPKWQHTTHTVLSTAYQFILKITGHSWLTHSFLELHYYSIVWMNHNLFNQSSPGGVVSDLPSWPFKAFHTLANLAATSILSPNSQPHHPEPLQRPSHLLHALLRPSSPPRLLLL